MLLGRIGKMESQKDDVREATGGQGHRTGLQTGARLRLREPVRGRGRTLAWSFKR